jgi:RimJ/RimL family protein N-acetyltransferase
VPDFVDAGVAEGGMVRLEPLGLQHVEGLCEAGHGDRELFRFTDVPNGASETEEYVVRAINARQNRRAVPFAVIDRQAGAVVGTSRFCYPEFWKWPDHARPRPADQPDAAQIGYTWFAASAQGIGVNRWSKLLMLTLAFESWKLTRVTFRTDARNTRSRAAILGIGATYEGTIRAEKIGYDGQIRDSAMYSILDREWPQVRHNLRARLEP